MAPGTALTQVVDPATPSIGPGFYYLARGSNVCGKETSGTTSGGALRAPTAGP